MPEAKTKGKGSATWAPAARMNVTHKKEGYGYRFLYNDPDNLEAKSIEGWVVPNKTNGLSGEFVETNDPVSGGRKHRDLILAVMDKETLAARETYYQTQADLQVSGLKNKLQRDLQSSSPTAVAHGTIEGHPAAPVIS